MTIVSCKILFIVQQTATTCMRIITNGCSLPFQYNNEEYNECINVVEFDTPQCVPPNGSLTNCIVPPGR